MLPAGTPGPSASTCAGSISTSTRPRSTPPPPRMCESCWAAPWRAWRSACRSKATCGSIDQDREDARGAVIRVHLKGTFLPTRHGAAYWRDRSKSLGGPVDARLINTSSSSGLFGNVGQSNYGTAKAGVAAFTIIAARELKRYGVTANAIMPHAQTRMTEDLRWLTPEQRARRDARWVPPIVVWLASRQSADVTGRVFEVGGGFFAVMEGWRRGRPPSRSRIRPRSGPSSPSWSPAPAA